MIMARIYRLPETPVTATYDAAVTATIRRWLIALSITIGLSFVAFVGVHVAAAGEWICFDRSPWWGPPEDPSSTCAGHFYESTHHVPFPQR
jgi:hypothetical protein